MMSVSSWGSWAPGAGWCASAEVLLAPRTHWAGCYTRHEFPALEFASWHRWSHFFQLFSVCCQQPSRTFAFASDICLREHLHIKSWSQLEGICVLQFCACCVGLMLAGAQYELRPEFLTLRRPVQRCAWLVAVPSLLSLGFTELLQLSTRVTSCSRT